MADVDHEALEKLLEAHKEDVDNRFDLFDTRLRGVAKDVRELRGLFIGVIITAITTGLGAVLASCV